MQQNERKASRTPSPRGRSPSGRMSRWPCKDYLKGTCNNSFCEKWHPPECLFYKTKSGCKFGEKCSYAHRQVDEQPSKKSKKNDDKSAVAMLKKYELHDRTGQLGHEQTMLNEVNMDFRILGLPHSVVKHAGSSRVRELVKKVENHPHRHSLQRELQQNEAYNPFSTTTKQMIHYVGNVELLELFETDPKTPCTERLSYWNEGIVYCTCGHFLKKVTEANRGFVKYTMDLLSIPEHVIKKGRPHGHRYGKTPEKKEYRLAKRDALKEGSQGSSRKWDDLAEQDFTYRMSEPEYFHHRQHWWISLDKSGDTGGPLRNRSDFNQALST